MSTMEFTKLHTILDPALRPETVDLTREYNLLGIRLDGGGAFLRETKLGSQTSAKTLFKVQKGDFIYSRLFAWRGAFDVINSSLDSYYVSSEFPTFLAKDDKVDPKFLLYWFRLPSTLERVEADCTGSTPLTRNRFKENFFLELEIPLPPLEEQRRIVARIEELAAKIEEARGLRREAEEDRELLISSSLSHYITSSSNEFLQLEEMCLQITDGEHATPPRIELRDQNIPLVTAKNVRDGYLDLNTTDFVTSDTAERCWRRCHPQHNDILMVCVGATTGRVCHLINPPDMVIVRSVAMLRPNKRLVDSQFLEYALKSSHCQEQIWSLVKQAAQPGLYIHRMKQLTIPLPPLEEQHRIVGHLDALQARVDTLKRMQAESSAELDALLPSILDRAFKGEL